MAIRKINSRSIEDASLLAVDIAASDATAVRAAIGLGSSDSPTFNAETLTTDLTLGTGTKVSGNPFIVNTNNVERLRIDNAGTVDVKKNAKGTVTIDNDLSFDMLVSNNFICTPTAGGTLSFTNITAGQSGNIILVNGANYAIAKAASIKCDVTFLTSISSTGTYFISYYSPDGSNVYVTTSGALS